MNQEQRKEAEEHQSCWAFHPAILSSLHAGRTIQPSSACSTESPPLFPFSGDICQHMKHSALNRSSTGLERRLSSKGHQVHSLPSDRISMHSTSSLGKVEGLVEKTCSSRHQYPGRHLHPDSGAGMLQLFQILALPMDLKPPASYVTLILSLVYL